MKRYKPLPVPRRSQVSLELERPEYRDIDPLPTMTAYVETSQRYQFANAAYREFFQLHPEQIAGRQARDVLGTKVYETIRPHMEKAVSGQSLTFDARMHINGGREHYCRTSLIPRKDGDRVDGVFILVSDLTELKRNEQKFQRLLESTDAIPWEANAKTWQFTYVGRQAKKILGYPIERWYEQDFWPQHIHPDDRQFALSFCESSSREKTDYEFEYRMQRADGQVVWLHDIVNVESLNGEPVVLRGYMIDVSARKRVEARVRERTKELAHTNETLKIEVTQRKHAEEELNRALAELNSLRRRLEVENRYLDSEVRRQLGDKEIIEESEAMRGVLTQAEQVASTSSSVLILGETGVGKEVLAQWIHDHSPRRNHSLIKVSCSALPESLVEAELFGHEKGAYTGAISRQTGRFEIADGSTIFLDEIGELAPEVQTKLLRVLQGGEFERLGSSKTISVDVRVIAATNADLDEAMRERRFRSDLYYRLNVFPIIVPPLRERVEDIPGLVWTFVKRLCEAMGKTIEHIEPRSMSDLQQYAWPGNVRELRNVVERAMIVSDGPTLRIRVPQSSPQQHVRATSLQVVERDHITEVLSRANWRVRGDKGAAELLGLKPTTLEARMKRLGIRRS